MYTNLIKTPVILIIAAMGLSMLAGCVSEEKVGRLQWELNALRADMAKISKTSRTIETKLPGQSQALDRRISKLQDRQDSAAKTVSDLLLQVQDLTREFQKLTGQFEESRYSDEKSSAKLIAVNDDLVSRVRELEIMTKNLEKKLTDVNTQMSAEKALTEQRAKAAEQKAREEALDAAKAAEKAKKKHASSAGVKDAYMSAYSIYRKGRIKEARDKFNLVLSDYPANEYSDNARFWIAETYYQEGNYEDAILAYEELFRKNPDSDKVPGAMLKQGLAFYALKDKKTGRIVLEKLIDQFPESEQARLATRKIKKVVPQKKNK